MISLFSTREIVVIRSIFLYVLFAFVFGCDFIQSFDLYIPKTGHLRNWVPELLNDSYQYQGIYATHDVDTIMFSVTIDDTRPNKSDFIDFADTVLIENGWVSEGNGIYHKYRGGGSCAVIKLAKQKDTNACVLGFVEGICRGPFTYENITSFGEFRWAKGQFWPKFEQAVEGIDLIPKENRR